MYLARDLRRHLPVQHLVLTKPRHLDRVKVPASPLPQALELCPRQQRCFLLPLSPHHLLSGPCPAAASLRCSDSSRVSPPLAPQQLRVPVSAPRSWGLCLLCPWALRVFRQNGFSILKLCLCLLSFFIFIFMSFSFLRILVERELMCISGGRGERGAEGAQHGA